METKSSFIIKAVRQLLDHDFSVLLYNAEQLEDSCGGWCWIDDDENKREFAVAMKHHMGFEIFIHEYCHFLQWKNDRKFWNTHTTSYDLLFDWIEDKDLVAEEKDLQHSLESILAIEHDCESRVLKLLKHNPILEFDTTKYIKAVNAYLWSYHLNKELRQRPNKPIYTEKVLESMSDTFESLPFYIDKSNLNAQIKQSLLIEYQTN